MENIKISGIEIYYPKNTLDVDEIIKEHKDKNEDVELEIKEFLGRKTIHIIDNTDENTLTMAIKASKKVLTSTNLTGSDIDMIAFSSSYPEYLSPPSSTFIHKALNASSSCICYDINVNCSGMLFSLTQIYMQMQSNPKINKVLLVGCDNVRNNLKEHSTFLDAAFGDAACALILEKTSLESKLVDFFYYTNPAKSIKEVAFPNCGSSHIYDVAKDEMKLRFGEGDAEINLVPKFVNNLLTKNNLDIADISMFCFSQFALYYIKYLRKELSIPPERAIYIGDEFGYTATSSPFIALYYAIKDNKVKRGDYVLLWTVGIGTQHIYALIKY